MVADQHLQQRAGAARRDGDDHRLVELHGEVERLASFVIVRGRAGDGGDDGQGRLANAKVQRGAGRDIAGAVLGIDADGVILAERQGAEGELPGAGAVGGGGGEEPGAVIGADDGPGLGSAGDGGGDVGRLPNGLAAVPAGVAGEAGQHRGGGAGLVHGEAEGRAVAIRPTGDEKDAPLIDDVGQRLPIPLRVGGGAADLDGAEHQPDQGAGRGRAIEHGVGIGGDAVPWGAGIVAQPDDDGGHGHTGPVPRPRQDRSWR
ncbi:hypothetical protein [Belnapia moabensis]|uniref:hypothetical protein n=1 Tax=Belnapia moabensis TaxID=365533 RepID=UPI0012ED659B|nr:hypothetical protein [Belnapia moabensis]